LRTSRSGKGLVGFANLTGVATDRAKKLIKKLAVNYEFYTDSGNYAQEVENLDLRPVLDACEASELFATIY